MKCYLRNTEDAGRSLLLSDLFTCCLLPFGLFSSSLANTSTSLIYDNVTNASLGLCLSSILTYFTDFRNNNPTKGVSLSHLGIAALSLFLFPSSSRTNTYILYWAIICLRPLVLWLIARFPQSFTFGECSLICQTIILTVVSLTLTLLSLNEVSMEAVVFFVLKNIQLLLDHLLQSTTSNMLLLLFWASLVLCAVSVVIVYHHMCWPVNTKTRKLFHLAIILVYVSGLLWNPMMLYVSSVAALSLMSLIELLRWSEISHLVSSFLTNAFQPFLDEKDSGSLILTNIYLLVGVSWPLWISSNFVTDHPAPLSLYTGVISVGIADSAASIVGSTYGRRKWMSSEKTLEGSLAATISSLAFIWMMSSCFGVVVDSWIAVVISVLGMVSVEAISSQVDNLTLPLVMFGLLNIAEYAL